MKRASVVDVQGFINEHPFGRFQRLVFLMCFVIVVLDGFDTAAIGFIAPSLLTQWHLAKPDLAPVLSAALFGLAFGALVSGPLSDRVGRRSLMIASVFLFGVACLVSAFSTPVVAASRRLLSATSYSITIRRGDSTCPPRRPQRHSKCIGGVRAVDSKDGRRFARFLTDNCTFVYANNDPVIGRAKVARDDLAGARSANRRLPYLHRRRAAVHALTPEAT